MEKLAEIEGKVADWLYRNDFKSAPFLGSLRHI
jgi:hypothetical protein